MKMMASVLFVVIMLSPAAVVAADSMYMALGGGSGGEADGSNFSVDVGGLLDTETDRRTLFAGGLTYISADELPSDTVGDPVTGTDFTMIGDLQKDQEYGAFLKLGMETIDRLFIFATGGFTMTEVAEVVQDNQTGIYHEQTSSENVEGLLGAGLIYFLSSEKFGLQLEYDNRRGVTGSVAFRF